MSSTHRTSWIDEETESPVIDESAKKLEHFVESFADGRIDESELEAQEQRVTELMKEIEPQLDDHLHERVTQLLCELTAYDIMQCFAEFQKARVKTAFRG